MFKQTPYKILTGSFIAAIIACSNIGPTFAFADEKPATVATNLELSNADVSAMNQYVSTVQKYPDISQGDFDKIKDRYSELSTLSGKMKEHQQSAVDTASLWKDKYGPALFQKSKDILNLNKQLQDDYNVLTKAVNEKNIDACKNVLSKFISNIEKYKDTLEPLSKDIYNYRSSLKTDIDNLTKNQEQMSLAESTISTTIQGAENEREKIKKELSTQLDLLYDLNRNIISIFQKSLYEAIEKTENKVSVLKKGVSFGDNMINTLYKELNIVKNRKDQIEDFKGTIQKGASSLDSISWKYSSILSTYKDLLFMVNANPDTEFDRLKSYIPTIQKDLKFIQDTASKFQ